MDDYQNGKVLKSGHSERVEMMKPLLRQVLKLLGEDIDRKDLLRTPERWAKALLEFTQGTMEDPKEHLRVIFQLDEEDFPTGSDDMIIVDNIEFMSLCEHHVAPFEGVVHVAYIPNPTSRVVTGLSKISRVVDVFSKRLQIQERMTQQIAQAIDVHLDPLGVIVVVKAAHMCMRQRGAKQRASTTLTTARRGLFLEDAGLENRFQRYLGLGGIRVNGALHSPVDEEIYRPIKESQFHD